TKALIYLSDIYISRQEDANAITTLEQAIHAGADYPDVHVRLAKLMSKIGKFNKAREHYARALKLNRNYREAADGVASLAA
ncbi:MAG: tetratricopeptide repeat protein, partial [Planctomycetes bacterium]|nr:tetratricopeptide repeat protein [Planctomycetota bacterium]